MIRRKVTTAAFHHVGPVVVFARQACRADGRATADVRGSSGSSSGARSSVQKLPGGRLGRRLRCLSSDLTSLCTPRPPAAVAVVHSHAAGLVFLATRCRRGHTWSLTPWRIPSRPTAHILHASRSSGPCPNVHWLDCWPASLVFAS